MRFDASQHQRMGQIQKLTPSMIQHMQVLQLPLAELESSWWLKRSRIWFGLNRPGFIKGCTTSWVARWTLSLGLVPSTLVWRD